MLFRSLFSRIGLFLLSIFCRRYPAVFLKHIAEIVRFRIADHLADDAAFLLGFRQQPCRLIQSALGQIVQKTGSDFAPKYFGEMRSTDVKQLTHGFHRKIRLAEMVVHLKQSHQIQDYFQHLIQY